jgi:GNAT superfamily N-acetyltransferase
MELPPGLRISFEDRPSWEDREVIYNTRFLRDPAFAYFGLFVRDDARAIRAGLIGHVYAGWLSVNPLWVHADLRRGGIGRGLMAEAERRAIALGCRSSYLDTFSFQAPGFYAKLGYREFGRIDNPPDHQRIFLQKQLTLE